MKVEVDEALVRLAGDLAEKWSLRGFDAIHLASAIALKKNQKLPVFFDSADGALNRAALSEGLK